jgi:hypothetical protein
VFIRVLCVLACVIGSGKLAEPDLERADALAAKARAGELTQQEECELDSYLTIGSVLEFLKSKTRRSLRQAKTGA